MRRQMKMRRKQKIWRNLLVSKLYFQKSPVYFGRFFWYITCISLLFHLHIHTVQNPLHIAYQNSGVRVLYLGVWLRFLSEKRKILVLWSIVRILMWKHEIYVQFAQLFGWLHQWNFFLMNNGWWFSILQVGFSSLLIEYWAYSCQHPSWTDLIGRIISSIEKISLREMFLHNQYGLSTTFETMLLAWVTLRNFFFLERWW